MRESGEAWFHRFVLHSRHIESDLRVLRRDVGFPIRSGGQGGNAEYFHHAGRRPDAQLICHWHSSNPGIRGGIFSAESEHVQRSRGSIGASPNQHNWPEQFGTRTAVSDVRVGNTMSVTSVPTTDD